MTPDIIFWMIMFVLGVWITVFFLDFLEYRAKRSTEKTLHRIMEIIMEDAEIERSKTYASEDLLKECFYSGEIAAVQKMMLCYYKLANQMEKENKRYGDSEKDRRIREILQEL